jgi:hypothetical protein
MIEPFDYGVGDRAFVECTTADLMEVMTVKEVLPNGSAILSSGATVAGVLFKSDGESLFGFFRVTKLIPKAA